MNKKISIILAGLIAVAVSSFAQATSIVEWDTTGATGKEATWAATANASDIAGLDLTTGSGLLHSSTGVNYINTNGWTQESTDYISFGFTVASGYEVDLSSLLIASKSSGTGPGSLGLYYSGDGYTTNLYTFSEDSNYLNSTVDLSVLTNLTGTVTFHIAQVGNVSANGGSTSSNGTFRVGDYYDGSNYSPLRLEGSVSAITAPVPEADTYALMLAGLGLVGFVARRRASV